MYAKTSTTKFKGLNSTVAPELIDDGEARDLLNFRMEKIGKLVTRDRYIVGLKTDPDLFSILVTRPTPATEQAMSYLVGSGIIGLGELILEEKWEDELDTGGNTVKYGWDTDRVMVYFIRGREFTQEERDGVIVPIDSDKRNRGIYLFSPMTGRYRNKLIINQNIEVPLTTPHVEVGDKRDAIPQGSNENETQLYAPNRYIPVKDDPDDASARSNDAPWIDHYVDMSQYRHQLIISDRTNGDLLLEDEFGRREIQQCDEEQIHGLHLRPNTLHKFDIDAIELDDRLTDENDETEGVESGMALYQFELPKIVQKISEDNYKEVFESLVDETEIDSELQKRGALIKLYNWQNVPSSSQAYINLYSYAQLETQEAYVFSNAEGREIVPHLEGKPKLPEDEFSDEDGQIRKETSANTYIWDDYKLQYYPSSGGTQGAIYLRDIDRIFSKLSSGPSITKLNPKTGPAQDVPLGVWRYKYVWDFGDGVYSAPSAELLCPDILWSATNDTDLLDGETPYERGRLYKGDEFLDQHFPKQHPYNDSDIVSDTLIIPRIFDDTLPSPQLTNFGGLFFDLKAKVYEGLNHRFGIKNWSVIADVNAATNIEKGEFATMVTVFYSASSVDLKGVIWQGFALSGNIFSSSGPSVLSDWRNVIDLKEGNAPPYFRHEGRLIVPIFGKKIGDFDVRTLNSLFDNYGRLRLGWAETTPFVSGNPNSSPRHMFVAPGINQSFDKDGWTTNPTLIHQALTIVLSLYSSGFADSNLYYNIVCQSPSGSTIDPGDWNNSEDHVYNGVNLNLLRPNTILRAVQDEGDRLSVTSSDIPVQVLDRLILSGVSEIHVVDTKDSNHNIFFASEKDETGFPVIDYDDARYSSGLEISNTTGVQQAANNPVVGTNVIDNVDIYVYGEGERFMGVEQLSAYFPSSLLFNAPRIAIKIPKDKVPARARKLLIYRTRASHNNQYQPNEYGLVDVIDVKRNDAGEATYEDNDGDVLYEGFYYFDKVKDSLLDFSSTPTEYEGLRDALKSRFNMALNERMYYANFIETYRPINPRSMFEYADSINNTYYLELPSETSQGFSAGDIIDYKYVYEDVSGIISKPATSLPITIAGASNRAVVLYFIPATFETYIERVKIYRAEGTNADRKYYFIGEITAEDEGVFVDDKINPGDQLPCTDADIINTESGVRWSEPFRPDHIKLTSLAEYRSGDGLQITGLETLYGNLVIFKETSFHRVAVQATDPPLSRTDEIDSRVGCIAPNTLINVDNMLYFLSWKGFMKYDNNVLSKVDGLFDEELQFILQNASHESIRDASCGYNPSYNEIYLNIPMLPTTNNNGRQDVKGHGDMYGYERELYGHIYVICLSKGYATKFAYQTSPNTSLLGTPPIKYYKDVYDVRQLGRHYHTNSLGELRSGDILPARYYSDYVSPANSLSDDTFWAGIYIETPYDPLNGLAAYEDYDEIMDGNFDQSFLNGEPVFNFGTTNFPPTLLLPVISGFKSKFFTGNAETMMKRVRKALLNIFSKGPIKMKGVTLHIDQEDDVIEATLGDDRISNSEYTQEFDYNPTVKLTDYILTNTTFNGTFSNILSFVPRSPRDDFNNVNDDAPGKPIRFSIEVESQLRTQINEVAIHWRPIYTYLS
ncbi:hypothetical protein LCGC14_0341880 [marine sediment metagenome]|uniref:Uncharacterized protein n=1 Tax=marine sediment metagenome TaxID=412755 RepID=A0A0F9W0I0_9ZZZZ